MDIIEFAEQLDSEIKSEIDKNGIEDGQIWKELYKTELASRIIEYMIDNGEVGAPELCRFQKTKARITAYDYNSDAESLDLFYLIKADNLASNINREKIHKGFEYLVTFYNEAMESKLFRGQSIDINDEISEVADLIKSTRGKINQLRLYIITDGLTEPSSIPEAEESEEEEFLYEYNVWDIQRIFQQYQINSGKTRVEIDFQNLFKRELQCIKMVDDNPTVDSYLTIIPGTILASIYKRYSQALLEKNVRTFLQFKGKVNKNIRKTLREQPNMFFSYNNGISTTASKVEIREMGRASFITKIYDWQIVNGGQTTASISALMNDKKVNLNQVYVPMKLSVIHDKPNYNSIVKDISTFANSQTAIKNSDFTANDPYLIELENMSRNIFVPGNNYYTGSKWFFERMRGQYIDCKEQLNKVDSDAFMRTYPKEHKITKTDIAKIESAWNRTPYDACRGAEQCYKLFATSIKRNRPLVTESYYTKLISKCIIFNKIDEIVSSQSQRGYKAHMNVYILSAISYLSDGKLDFNYIWERHKLQDELVAKIEELVPIVWKHLTSTDMMTTSNVSAWSRKTECWDKLKSKLTQTVKLHACLEQPDYYSSNNTSCDNNQQSIVNEMMSIESNYWFSLVEWAKSHNSLTPMEIKTARNYGTYKSRGKKLSYKEAENAKRIIDKAKENGFEE